MISIETKRLILRNFLETDAAGLLDYMQDPSPNCFKPDRLKDLAEASAEVTKRRRDDQMVAVCLRESGSLIGDLCGLKEEPDTYSLCWHFRAQSQGQGYATEAAGALISYLFQNRMARRVYAYVEEDNLPSQKLCRRLGMRLEGRFVEFISFVNHSDGSPKYETTLQYALLSKEWVSKVREPGGYPSP